MNVTISPKEFAVALSFPGEHRRLVRNVANHLAATLGRHRVFYDDWYRERFIGIDVDISIANIFSKESQLIVPFFSTFYQKKWCQVEWRVIRGLLIERREKNEIIPIYMDDSEYDGWSKITDLGINRNRKTGRQLAEEILDIYRNRYPDEFDKQYDLVSQARERNGCSAILTQSRGFNENIVSVTDKNQDSQEIYGSFIPKYMGIIGFKEHLDEIDKWFNDFKNQDIPFLALLKGKRGMGKTHLAAYFAFKKRKSIQGNIYIVDANGLDIHSSVKKLAEHFEFNSQLNLENQASSIFGQVPVESILILDDVGVFDGYETLSYLKKIFVIVTTDYEAQTPIVDFMFKKGEMTLVELSENELEEFFQHRLKPEIVERIKNSAHSWDDLIKREQRSPFFLEQACKIVEHIYYDKTKDIHQLISDTKEELREVGAEIAKYAVDKVWLDQHARSLLLACALFNPGRIPLQQVYEVMRSGEKGYSEAVDSVISWGILSRLSYTDGKNYLVMHDYFHSYLQKKFDQETPETQYNYRKRYIQAWFRFLLKSNSIQSLLGVYENIRTAIGFWSLPDFDNCKTLNMKELSKDHLEIFQLILPPKERRRFLHKLMEELTDSAMIAYIFDGIAESYLRIGSFTAARLHAEKSLLEFSELCDEQSQIIALRRLGTIYRSMSRFKDSKEIFEKALALVNTNNDKQLIKADIERQLSHTLLEMGDTHLAYQAIVQSVSILQGVARKQASLPEVRNSLAYALNSLGNVEIKLGQYSNAYKHITRAMKIHEGELGANHFYVGYDLRYLAKVELGMKMPDKAIRHLERSLEINKSFFGESPNVAMIKLLMAESYLIKKDFAKAKILTYEAKDFFDQRTGIASKYFAYTERILSEIYIGEFIETNIESHLQTANQHLQSAAEALTTNHKSPHMTYVRFVEGKLNLCEGKIDRALEMFWKVRSDFVRFGFLGDLNKLDELMLYAMLKQGVKEWDKSAEAYQAYLVNFPGSLHNQLGNRLVSALEDDLRKNHAENSVINVLDVFCGTGHISRAISQKNLSNVHVTGIDGSIIMINMCKEWKHNTGNMQSSFIHIPDRIADLNGKKFQYVTIHMGIFQIDLRARHFLFQRLLLLLDNDCTIILSTHAADFVFPKEYEKNNSDINKDNPFKEKLLREFLKKGHRPSDYHSSIKPVLAKENLHNLTCFFELYGFEITPSCGEPIGLLAVKRPWADRVSFSQIPVISRKIFNKEIPAYLWNELDEQPGYFDMAYGAIIMAKRIKQFDAFSIFSNVNVDFSKGYKTEYAVAAVLKNKADKALFLQRGLGARDSHDSWSLSSTFADEGMGLQGSFKESFSRNTGISEDKVSDLTPVSIRFNMRKDGDNVPWIMAMCLFKGYLDEEVELITPKYQDFSWTKGSEFISKLSPKKMGDCTKSYRDLIRCGKL